MFRSNVPYNGWGVYGVQWLVHVVIFAPLYVVTAAAIAVARRLEP